MKGLFLLYLVFLEHFLCNKKHGKCHDDEIDQVCEELPPCDNDRPDGDRCSLPGTAGNEERDDGHQNVINTNPEFTVKFYG